MASPFAVFRKHQKILIATLGLMAMIAFVFLPMILKGVGEGGGNVDPIVVTSNFGNLTERQLQNLRYRRKMVMLFLQRAVDAAAFDRETTFRRKMDIEQFFGKVGEESIVDLWLLVQRAKRLGMRVSDGAVSDFIGSAITDNRVTNEQFAHLYKTMRASEDVIFDTLQEELLARELQEAFSTALGAATPAQRWEYFQRLNRKVEIEVAAVPVADYLDRVEDPGDDVLEEFFEEHKEKLAGPMSPQPGFRVPSKAAVEYVKADVSKYLDVVPVTDEEIEEYYMKNRDKRFVKPELPGLDEEAKPEVKLELPGLDEEAKPEVKPAPVEAEKPTEPNKDAPNKDDPSPQAKKTSARDSNSLLRLVSMADEKPVENKPVENKPVENKPVENKPVENKPVEKKPVEKKAEDKPAAKPDQDSKYQPLDSVRADIRQILADEKQAAAIKAFGEVETSLQPIREAVTNYRQALSQYDIKRSEEEDAVKPQPPDFEALAKGQGLTFHKTGMISAAEMLDLDIGRSMVDGGQSLLGYIYSTSNLNRPRVSSDMGQNIYMFWKTDSSEEEVPKFEDEGIRATVLAAWKMDKAREIARKEAEKLAEEARQAKKTLVEAFGSLRPVEKSGPFSWMLRAPAPDAQGQTRLLMSRVEHVDKPGDKFMSKVYDLEVGEIGVAMNRPEDVAYVVQLEKTEPSDTVLWIGFKADPYSLYQAVGNADQMEIFNTWIDGIRKAADLKWERKPVPPAGRGR